MRYLSLCSGIEAASVAWTPLGWEAVAFAEIEKFPNAVLKHHYPNVPNLGNVSLITEQQIKDLGHVDVCIFGFPCTDLSVAGQRKGLKHEDGTNTRSGLFFDCHKVARWSGARFVLVENVHGLFSSHEGRDFTTVVGELAGAEISVPEDGWRNSGFALGSQGLVEWAVLDAQWFGVAQRRERVFLILDTGDWSNRPPILSQPESYSGNSAPSREKREETSRSFTPSSHGGYKSGVGSLRANGGANGGGSENLAVIPINMQAASKCGAKSPNMLGIGESSDPAYTVNASDRHAIAFRTSGNCGVMEQGDRTAALNCATDPNQNIVMTPEEIWLQTCNCGHKYIGPLTMKCPACGKIREGLTHGDPILPLTVGTITKSSGHSATTATGQDAAAGLIIPVAGTIHKRHGNTQLDQTFIPEVAWALQERDSKGSDSSTKDGHLIPVVFYETQITSPKNHSQTKPGEIPSHPLSESARPPTIAFERRMVRTIGGQPQVELQHALRADSNSGDGAPCVATHMAVRRLTPKECLRLQGFPDNYLSINFRGKPACDSPKYKAIGNSFAVPCVRWIGQRIQDVATKYNA